MWGDLSVLQQLWSSFLPLVDSLSSIVGRININVQCGRSPDVVPFSGRRSSAQVGRQDKIRQDKKGEGLIF